jgi:hypothetical protein
LDEVIGGERDLVTGRLPAIIEHALPSNFTKDKLGEALPTIFPLIRTVPLGDNVIPDTTPWDKRGLEQKGPINLYRGREVPRDAERRISPGGSSGQTREKSISKIF